MTARASSGRTVIASGQAQVRMPLGSGAHTLTALYTGSASYTASTSAPLSQVVTSVAENGFQPLKSFAAGAGPRGVAAGDFNGDGKTDFVVAVLPGQLKLFLNNGAGGFTQSSVGASIQASAVATGDFNGDGKLDLAVALFTNSQVGIYLGNGDGTFKTAVNYPVGTNPYHVAVGDFNNDGIADLVLPNKGTNDMSVLLGKGDGTFRAAVSYPTTGSFSIYASIADFDGDGNADIVIPNNTSASMTLFLGKGDGTFKTPINIPTRVEPFTTKAVDLNGDGKMDLLVTSAHQFSVGVYLGNGDGTFQPATYYDSGAEPHFVDTADFNGDGKADLIIADFEEAAVSVLLGNGDGTFQPKKTYFATGPNGTPQALALADFNGDGAVDVVIVDFHAQTIVVRYGNTLATNTDVPMPNLFGMTQAQATAALHAVGLSASAFTSIVNPATAGTVVDYLEDSGAQTPYNPNPGTLLPVGTAVQVVLSSGPGTVSVYPVADQTVAEASLLLQESGVVLGTVTTAPSSTTLAGNIISQSPAAFATVSTGTQVSVVVSTGLGGLVSVPNVAGLTQAVATSAIQGAALVVGTVTTASSSTVAAGSVISENPAAGTQVNTGTAVNLVVSSGPNVTQVAVPNVVGQTQTAATTAIQAAGLVIGTVTTASSSTVAAGSVISENPVAGTQVNTGTAVNLVVSSGPNVTQVAVPNVVGQTQASATSAIQSVGLVVGTVTTASSSTVAAGSVISENPVAGTQVNTGSSVSLVVSSGAAQGCGAERSGSDAGVGDVSYPIGRFGRRHGNDGIEQHGSRGQRDQRKSGSGDAGEHGKFREPGGIERCCQGRSAERSRPDAGGGFVVDPICRLSRRHSDDGIEQHGSRGQRDQRKSGSGNTGEHRIVGRPGGIERRRTGNGAQRSRSDTGCCHVSDSIGRISSWNSHFYGQQYGRIRKCY